MTAKLKTRLHCHNPWPHKTVQDQSADASTHTLPFTDAADIYNNVPTLCEMPEKITSNSHQSKTP
jgi:hypothetical protein